MAQMNEHETVGPSPDRGDAKRKDFNTAVWFFVAAVFVAVSPNLGEPMNVSIPPLLSWCAAALLTVIGFWLMLRKPK